MNVEASVEINGSKEAIWAKIADIENIAKVITGIQKIEVLHKPASGVVGYKWNETRVVFGKSATVTMWVTEAAANEFYTKRAEQDGCIYLATFRIAERTGHCVLTFTHETQPQTFMRRLLLPAFALILKGVMRKFIRKDLADIKAAVEGVGKP